MSERTTGGGNGYGRWRNCRAIRAIGQVASRSLEGEAATQATFSMQRGVKVVSDQVDTGGDNKMRNPLGIVWPKRLTLDGITSREKRWGLPQPGKPEIHRTISALSLRSRDLACASVSHLDFDRV
jgi:hypothetical protein